MKTTTQPTNMGRRRALKASAALAGAIGGSMISMPAFTQNVRNIKFTLPWLAQGATAYAYIADDQNLFKKHGIKANISRGFGSLAAAQAIANKQFDFGLVSASSTIISAATGLPLKALGTTNYDAYMGILVLDSSPIRSPKDLEGKSVGCVPASTEFPLWPAFANSAGIDVSKIKLVQADSRVLERMLVDKQIDAALCVTSTSYAVAKIMGAPTRAMLWSKNGLPFYSNNIVTQPQMYESNPELCQGVTEALLEALAFTLRDPEAALAIFLKKVPELTLTAGGEEFARLSQGFMLASVPGPEAKEHGLGYSDFKKVDAMTSLVLEYAAKEVVSRPVVDELFTNQFVGKIKLTDDEWRGVHDYTRPFSEIFG